MIKNFLLLLVWTSMALWMGCARGVKSIATVTVSGDRSVVAVSLTATFKAKIDGVDSTAVNWSVSSNSCTGSACGTVDSSGVYTAPATLPAGKNSMVVAVIATSQADAAATAQAAITVLPITVSVSPAPVQVGQGLVQQFTAAAVPDYVAQTFTWSVTCTQAGACGTIAQDPATSGLAVYTAPAAPPNGCTSGNCVMVTATSTLNSAAPSSTSANVMVVKSRVSGTYAFRFSGYDSLGSQVELAGSVTLLNGAVTGGVVDQVTGSGASQGHNQYSITSGAYVPSLATDNNTNDAGTLTLTSGASVTQFRTVLSSNGEIQMIEPDGNGNVHGSGIMQKSAAAQFNTGAQKFVFLFTGLDPIGKRVGFIGLLPLDGTATTTTKGNISAGMLDINDGGTPSTFTGITGTYGPIPANGAWPMTLSAGGNTWGFTFYVGSGQTQSGTNPLTLLAISTDPPSVHPALSGTFAFQDPSIATWDKTRLSSSAVSHLDGLDNTGSNTSVALAVASGDSNGNISGSFDALNFGNPTTTVAAQNFTCTYTAGTGGRYVVTLLGNNTTCTSPAIPFVFYASGANRGFLLDQSSAAVMAGAMDPQASSSSPAGTFADSTLPGTYAMATASGGTSGVDPLAGNLVLTFVGAHPGTAAGTLYDPLINPPATGSYSIQFVGTGSIMLTPQGAAHSDNFSFYAVDTSHFWMIQTQDTAGNTPANPALFFMQQ